MSLTERKKSLASSASYYTFVNFINRLIPFLLLPILTRQLSTEEYGIVTMFNAMASFLIPLVGMSVPTAITRQLVETDKKSTSEYIFNCLLVVIVGTSLISIIILLASPQVSSFTGVPQSLLPFVCLYTVTTVACQVTQSVLQMLEKIRLYGLFTNLDTLLNALLSLTMIICLDMGVNGRIFGLLFSKSFLAAFGVIYIKRTLGLRTKLNTTYIKNELIDFGLPLIPTQLKTTVLTYTDKILLTNLVSISATGIYTVGDQFASPISFLAQSFNLAFVPWLFKKLSNDSVADKRHIVKITYIYFIGILILATVWSAVSSSIVGWIAGESYLGASEYTIYLSFGYAFSGMHMMVVNYIYYAKKVKLYSLVTIAIIVINIILSILFLKMNGPVGAAQATLVSNVISFLLTWVLAARVWNMPWNLLGRVKRDAH